MTIQEIVLTLIVNNAVMLLVGLMVFRIKLEARLVRLETLIKMILQQYHIEA